MARSIIPDWPYARVFLSRNGWYAVVVGSLKYPSEAHLLNHFKANGDGDKTVPHDAFLTAGGDYIEEVHFRKNLETGNADRMNSGGENGIDSQAGVASLGGDKQGRTPKVYKGVELWENDVVLNCEGVTLLENKTSSVREGLREPNREETEKRTKVFDILVNFDRGYFMVLDGSLFDMLHLPEYKYRYEFERVEGEIIHFVDEDRERGKVHKGETDKKIWSFTFSTHDYSYISLSATDVFLITDATRYLGPSGYNESRSTAIYLSRGSCWPLDFENTARCTGTGVCP